MALHGGNCLLDMPFFCPAVWRALNIACDGTAVFLRRTAEKEEGA